MKTTLGILFFIGIAHSNFAQQVEEEVITTSSLSYNREIPESDTYKVVKNLSLEPVPTKVLEEINLYRRFDQNYTWYVNSQLEILIYPVGTHIQPEVYIEYTKGL